MTQAANLAAVGSTATSTGKTAYPGAVLQVVQATYSTNTSTASTTYVTTNLTASITPSSSSSKILVMASVAGAIAGAQGVNSSGLYTIYKNSTQVSGDVTLRTYNYGGGGGVYLDSPMFLTYLDSPATTSSTAYTVYMKCGASQSAQLNGDTNTSYITLMEIAA